MANTKPNSIVTVQMILRLDEKEIRALLALSTYSIEDFLKTFYELMGKDALQPHEEGLRSLFETINRECREPLKNVDTARKLLKNLQDGYTITWK